MLSWTENFHSAVIIFDEKPKEEIKTNWMKLDCIEMDTRKNHEEIISLILSRNDHEKKESRRYMIIHFLSHNYA